MNLQMRLSLIAGIVLSLSLILFHNTQLDIITSSWFFDGHDFDWKLDPVAIFLHDLVLPVGYILCVTFLVMGVYRFMRQGNWKVYAFLLLSLIIGPGIITNTLLKDNWDRARPSQIVEFGGTKNFTPPLVMANPSQCPENCSFVSGDAAFAFWFHSFMYVVPASAPRRRRLQYFWGGLVLGGFYGVLRIGMGAHFLSDVFFAGIFMMMSSAALYAAIMGRAALGQIWTEILGSRRTLQQLAH